MSGCSIAAGGYPKERLYKSIDSGATFYPLDLGAGTDMESLKQIFRDPRDSKNLNCSRVTLSQVQPQVVFALSAYGKLHRSGDGATTWQPVADGLPTAPEVQAFELSPKSADVRRRGRLRAAVHALTHPRSHRRTGGAQQSSAGPPRLAHSNLLRCFIVRLQPPTHESIRNMSAAHPETGRTDETFDRLLSRQ